MTTHMESNRKRIAKVRAENLARQQPARRGGPKKEQRTPNVALTAAEWETYTHNPDRHLTFAFVYLPDRKEFTIKAVYKGHVLEWTDEQVTNALWTCGSISKAFNRDPTNGEEAVIAMSEL